MTNKKYFPTLGAIYLNYALLGVATVIISQYSTYFQEAWHTDLKGISSVISMIGIGRIVTILFAGPLSDKIGRKPIALAGLVSMSIYLIGLSLATNTLVASFFALFFGFTQSLSDAACYPAIADACKEKSPSMTSLVKASISTSQLLLPFLVAAVPNAKITLWIFVAIVVVNFLIFWVVKFAPQVAKTETATANKLDFEPKMSIDGVALIIIGFTSAFTFYLFMQYMPSFGANILHLSDAASKGLVSWYAAASLISVFCTSIIVTKIKPTVIVLVYPLISVIFLVLLVLFPSVMLAKMTGLVIGFFAAGGVWQLGLSILTNYFPGNKGRVTSLYSFAAALCYYVGPALSGFLLTDAPNSINRVFWLDIVVTIIGVCAASLVFVRARSKKNA